MSNRKNALVQQLKDFLTAQATERAALASERITLEDRRERLLDAPLSREDFKAQLLAFVDVCGAKYLHLQNNIRTEIAKLSRPSRNATPGAPRPSLSLRDALHLESGNDAAVLGSFDGMPHLFVLGIRTSYDLNIAACFYFGEQIKAKLDAHFDTLYAGLAPAQDAAPGDVPASLAQRREELAAIEVRLAKIASAIASIDADVAEATNAARSVPTDAEALAEAQRQIAKRLDFEREVYTAYNGRNEADVASQFKITAREVLAIANDPRWVGGGA